MTLVALVIALGAIWLARIVLSAPVAFVLMLALGAAHATWPVVPALGFLVVWLLVLGVQLAVGLLYKTDNLGKRLLETQ